MMRFVVMGGRRAMAGYAGRMHETTLERAITLAIFIGSYVGLGLGRFPGFRVDRTGVAIIGGALMVLSGVLPWNDAVLAVDAHTLVLLFGMMIVAAYLRLSGFFSLVTLWAIRRAKTPRSLLAVVIAAAGVLSALFVNDVVCLVMAPLVVGMTHQLALPPLPTWWPWPLPPTSGVWPRSRAIRRTCSSGASPIGATRGSCQAKG